jgi:BirA family biotin operon repressor/biotin-[acetyl-CoA-carboxylase] ligase
LRLERQVSSTNHLVKEAIREGVGEGFAVASLEQTGGYGRQGRAWSSPQGGLYASFLLRPAVPMAQRPTLSLVASMAVREAITQLAPQLSFAIKWPNDLLHEGAKVNGISLEVVGDALCVGIGINVFRPFDAPVASDKYRFGYVAEFAPKAFPGCETSVSAEGLTPNQELAIARVLVALLVQFQVHYLAWCQSGFAPFREEYEVSLFNKGGRVSMETVDGRPLQEGLLLGVDDEGRLLVLGDDAVLRPVSSGEVHITNHVS